MFRANFEKFEDVDPDVAAAGPAALTLRRSGPEAIR